LKTLRSDESDAAFAKTEFVILRRSVSLGCSSTPGSGSGETWFWVHARVRVSVSVRERV
jgi:hypothetical protein